MISCGSWGHSMIYFHLLASWLCCHVLSSAGCYRKNARRNSLPCPSAGLAKRWRHHTPPWGTVHCSLVQYWVVPSYRQLNLWSTAWHPSRLTHKHMQVPFGHIDPGTQNWWIYPGDHPGDHRCIKARAPSSLQEHSCSCRLSWPVFAFPTIHHKNHAVDLDGVVEEFPQVPEPTDPSTSLTNPEL